MMITAPAVASGFARQSGQAAAGPAGELGSLHAAGWPSRRRARVPAAAAAGRRALAGCLVRRHACAYLTRGSSTA